MTFTHYLPHHALPPTRYIYAHTPPHYRCHAYYTDAATVVLLSGVTTTHVTLCGPGFVPRAFLWTYFFGVYASPRHILDVPRLLTTTAAAHTPTYP